MAMGSGNLKLEAFDFCWNAYSTSRKPPKRPVERAAARTRKPDLVWSGPEVQAYTLGIPGVSTKSCWDLQPARSGRVLMLFFLLTVRKRSSF
jgi:hypothetical protein